MIAALLLVMLGDPVPVAGRPADFSGAVGGAFVVTAAVDRADVVVGEPFDLTIEIVGPGDLSRMRRPNLRGDTEFLRRFDIDVAVGGDTSSGSGRTFRYTLRARDARVDHVPWIKVVSFNPQLRQFQTTYTDPVPLRVRPPAPPQRELGPEVQAWVERVRQAEQAPVATPRLPDVIGRWLDKLGLNFHASPSGWFYVSLWLLPPTGCLLWYWARSNRSSPPDPTARRALEQLQTPTGDPARQVAETVCQFLRAKVALPESATSPAAVSAYLYEVNRPASAIDRVRSVLARCDEARYSARPVPAEDILAEARQLIERWGRR